MSEAALDLSLGGYTWTFMSEAALDYDDDGTVGCIFQLVLFDRVQIQPLGW